MTGEPSAEQPGSSPSRRSRLIMAGVISAILLVFVIGPGILLATTPHPHGTPYDTPVLVEDFELPSASGGTFRLSDHRGKVIVVYFGYTSCPDVCPTTLFDLRRAVEMLGEEGRDVEVVFMTVDPDYDTPQKIAEYLSYFNPSFIGLYGTQEELAAVRDLFAVRVQREDEGQTIRGYTLTHTTSMFIIDRDGYLTLRMLHGTDVEYLVRDLRYVLRGRL
jgi:protein SCO1/2